MSKPRAGKGRSVKKPARARVGTKAAPKAKKAPRAAKKPAAKKPAAKKPAAKKKVAARKKVAAAKKRPKAKPAAKKKVAKRGRKGVPAPRATQPSAPPPMSVKPRSSTAFAPASKSRAPRESSTMDDDVRPSLRARSMDLSWEEFRGTEDDARTERWVARGELLLQLLEEHGCGRHEYRADLKDGRFVWLDFDGVVSAEAKARVLCSWSRSTNVLVMGWADPLVRSASTGRLDDLPSERDDVSEEEAWRVAMTAADAVKSDHLYRVPAPHAWYFLALDEVTFAPASQEFSPSTPVHVVLRSLDQTRKAIESRAETASTVRERLADVGSALLREASFAYRETDWVARLERTGRCLMTLANRLPRPSYSSIAAGRNADEWLTREATLDLIQAIGLLEDEWALFA